MDRFHMDSIFKDFALPLYVTRLRHDRPCDREMRIAKRFFVI